MDSGPSRVGSNSVRREGISVLLAYRLSKPSTQEEGRGGLLPASWDTHVAGRTRGTEEGRSFPTDTTAMIYVAGRRE